MHLTTTLQGQPIEFDLTVYADETNELLYFLILLPHMAFILAKKENAKGKWSRVSGTNIAEELQQAIFDRVDNVAVNKLSFSIREFSKLNPYYLG